MNKFELVFAPSPGIGHFVSTTEFAKSLLDKDERLSVTILVISPPGACSIEAQIKSLAASQTRIKCCVISLAEPSSSSSTCDEKFVSDFIASHKPHIENVIVTDIISDESVCLVGIVVDFFCTSMIDIANKLTVPCYLFFTSSAAFLGFMMYLPVRHDRVGAEYGPLDGESIVPTYKNLVPKDVVPTVLFNKDIYKDFVYHGTKFKEMKGFIVNTFAELEPYAVSSFMMKPPPIYTVGPLLNLNVKEKSTGSGSKSVEIMTWLDEQPRSSVVFLCFGSRGCFDTPQLEHIAMALERSGQRFLWSVRRPPPKESLEFPTEYENIPEALPEGFWGRTEKRGKVCGWAPQVEVLAHEAIGGFVSHCGWNSILESLWYGVPIATWPLHAEQQINAFQMVRELGLAVELKMDYSFASGEVVMADVIEKAVNCLMDGENPVRKKVKEMSEKSWKAVEDGGSCSSSLGRLIEDLFENREKTD